MSLPRALTFSNIDPIGLSPETCVEYRIPATGNLPNSVDQNTSDIFFQWSNDRGFLDPYCTYIRIEVETFKDYDPRFPDQKTYGINGVEIPYPPNTQHVRPGEKITEDSIGRKNMITFDTVTNKQLHVMPTMPDGTCMQLDGSAQNFFSQMELRCLSDSVELETIRNYDVLAGVLNDMTYDPAARIQRSNEGYGSIMASNIGQVNAQQGRGLSANAAIDSWWTKPHIPYGSSSVYSADTFNIGPNESGVGLTPNNQNGVAAISFPNRFGAPNLQHPTSAADKRTNQGYGSYELYTGNLPVYWTTQFWQPGRTDNGLIYDANKNSLCYTTDINTIKTANSDGFYGLPQQPRRYVVRELLGADYSHAPQADWMKNSFNTTNIIEPTFFDAHTENFSTLMNYPKVSGYECPYSYDFCKDCNEPRFSKDTPQKMIRNGKPIANGIIFKETFYVPLLSCTIGALIPVKNYKLIPMWSFGQMSLRLYLNPFAFFCSDASLTRSWKVNRCELCMTMITYPDAVQNSIAAQTAGDGISFHTAGWYSGPSTNIINNIVPASITLNEPFTSLRMLLLCFLDRSYRQYSNVRKHYRLSMNLTELQLQVGMEEYPRRAIMGYAGTNRGPDNCAEFLIHLLKAFGKLWNFNTDHQIGMANFSLNSRVWTPGGVSSDTSVSTNSTMDTMNLDATLVNTKTSAYVGNLALPYLANETSCRTNNAGSIGFFHENRVKGKAVYAIDTEMLSREGNVMGGLNTINKAPFMLRMNSDTISQGTKVENAEMYIFYYYDKIIRIRDNNIYVQERT